MKNKKGNGIVYKVENTITKEIYVGVTTGSIEIRIKDHLDKAKRGDGHKFQEAIATYGADAFQWEQVDTANSINELAAKEKQYIIKYNSKENGYNIDAGGGFKKDVYKYDRDGKLVQKFECLEDAAKTVNATKQMISRACLNVNNSYGSYFWSYQSPYKSKVDKRNKTVLQLELNGVIVNKYKSVAMASKNTSINKTSIGKVCRNERRSAGGYLWAYLDNEKGVF